LPKEAIQRGGVERTVPLQAIAGEIMRQEGASRRARIRRLRAG
jgi:chemotaxis response regulator CheB